LGFLSLKWTQGDKTFLNLLALIIKVVVWSIVVIIPVISVVIASIIVVIRPVIVVASVRVATTYQLSILKINICLIFIIDVLKIYRNN